MLNKELCKQLKEAGFPQGRNEDEDYFDEIKCENIYNPTLSELIDECGGDFINLEKDIKGFAVNKFCTECCSIENNPIYYKTKKEAVAKLYIQLYG